MPKYYLPHIVIYNNKDVTKLGDTHLFEIPWISLLVF